MTSDKNSRTANLDLMFNELLLLVGQMIMAQPGKMKELASLGEQIEVLKQETSLLKQDRDRYKSLVEFASDTIATFNLDGIMTYTSPNWPRSLGHDTNEVVNQNIFAKLFHPDDIEPAMEYLNKAIRTKSKQRGFVYRIKNAEGEWKWHTANLAPILDASGEVVSILAIAHDIDERKRSEDSVRENEAKYSLLLNTMQEGVIYVDNDDGIQYINKSLCDLYGFKSEEVIGRKGYEVLIHEDDHKVILEKNKLREAGIKDQYEVRGRKPNGEIVFLRISGAPLLNDKLQTIGSVGVMTDITQEHMIQQALKESEAKYRSLVENSVVGVFQSTYDDKYLFVNQTFATMFGYDNPKDMMDKVKDIRDLYVNPEDRDRLKEILTDKGYAENFQVCLRKPNGEEFWALINSRLDCNTGQDYCTIDSTCIDISDRVKAETEMYRLHHILNNSRNEIYVLDCPSFSFAYANRGALQNTGYSLEDLTKLSFSDLHKDMSRDKFERLIKPLLSGKKDFLSYEAEHLRKDNSSYPVEVNLQLDKENDTGVIVAIVNDITLSKSLREQLYASQKLEAVGKLAGGIAHDFNNLLTVIQGYSNELLSDLSPTDPTRESAEEISTAANKATALTKQLLAFSRKQVIQPRALNLNKLLQDMQKMLKRIIGENIDLKVSLEKDLDTVKVDPGQFEQVIMNLVVNAKDAMPLGGTLAISTANLSIDEPYAGSHTEIEPGQYIAISVTDDGSGMDEETQKQAFEPFFTTKGVGKGSGLGLSTVYGIIRQSSGHVLVYSIPMQGTTIKILLPSVNEQAIDIAAQSYDIPHKGSGERILVVEDDESVCRYVRKVLEGCNYKVLAATSGMEALELIRDGYRPDLVLTDIIMPGIHGKHLADQLQQIVPNLQILFMSGFNNDALGEHSILAHDLPFIQKPFSAKQISDLISQMLQRKKVQEVVTQPSILMLDDDEQIRTLFKRIFSRNKLGLEEAANLEQALRLLSSKRYDLILLDMNLAGMSGSDALSAIRSMGHKTPVIVLSGALDPTTRDRLESMGVKQFFEKTLDNTELIQAVVSLLGK